MRSYCFLELDGFSHDRAFARFQARVAKTLGHRAISFRAEQLVRRCEVPDVRATHFEIDASSATEQLQNFRGRKSLGRSRRKLEQEFLKSVVIIGSNHRRS